MKEEGRKVGGEEGGEEGEDSFLRDFRSVLYPRTWQQKLLFCIM